MTTSKQSARQRLGATVSRSGRVWFLLALIVTAGSALAASATSASVSNRVLILEETVTGGTASVEATEAASDGMAVDIVNNATWNSMTATQFASYRAIILGDPTCYGPGTSPAIDTATTNAKTWGPIINGNIVIAGTDPVYHNTFGSPGGGTLTRRAVDFALAQTGKTGAYISLSCYYHGTAANTPVPLLEGIGPGGFTVTGVGCYNDAHIVAASPALAGLADADLSGWSCSVHEAFRTWPGALVPLAIARDFDSSYTASDGTQGPPYILAGGNIQSFPLSLSPHTGSAVPGSSYTVTAQLLDAVSHAPIVGAKIGFAVLSGPNVGVSGPCNPSNCRTSSSGQVTFTYRSNGTAGSDTIQTFYDQNEDGIAQVGEPQTTASVKWATPKGLYIALGDSYSSGESTSPYLSGSDTHDDKCHRSTFAYPFHLNLDLAFYAQNFSFHACSGAHINDFYYENSHNRPEPRQLSYVEAAGSRTQLVTLSIGGNDAHFADVVATCYADAIANSLGIPHVPCEIAWNTIMDNAIHTMSVNSPSNRQSLTQLYDRIAAKAPRAQIIVVGYPRFFPESPPSLCSTGLGPTYFNYAQMLWLNQKVSEGDRVISAAVAATGNSRVHYVAGSYSAFNGHERCTREPYLNGIVGSSAYAGSFHPNINGQRALASLAEKTYHP